VRLGERHGHVQVGDARLEAGVEDRLVEDRVDRVQDRVRLRLADQAHHVVPAAGVDPVRREAAVVGRGHERLGPREVVVGERAVLEERAAARDRGEGRADAAGSDDQDSHGWGVLPDRLRERLA